MVPDAALAGRDAEPPLAPVVGDVQLTEERRVRTVVVARLVRRVVEAVHGLLPPAVARVRVQAGARAGLLDPAVAAREQDLAALVHVVAQHLRVAHAPRREVLGPGERERALRVRRVREAPVVRRRRRPGRPPAGAGRRPCSTGRRRSARARRGRRSAWTPARRSGPAAERRRRTSRRRSRWPRAPRRARRGSAARRRTASCWARGRCSPRPRPRARAWRRPPAAWRRTR